MATPMTPDPALDPRITFAFDDGVATITIAQPAKRNAVAPAMWDALAAHFTRCSADPAVRVVVLTGDGDYFCSGSDLGEIDFSNDIASGLARLKRANRMMLAIHNCEKPVIAAVPGPAVGVGWSIALAADFIVAADKARFGGGFVRVGLMPDGGSIFFLSRLLGAGRAKELAYTGRLVAAEEALALGMAIRVSPAAKLAEDARAFARELAQGPTTTIALAKRMFRAGFGPSLEQYFDAEEMAQVCAKKTDDFAEGMTAFRERRPTRFTGR